MTPSDDRRWWSGFIDLAEQRIEAVFAKRHRWTLIWAAARGEGWRYRGRAYDPGERPAGPWRLIGNTGYVCECGVITYGWANACGKCGKARGADFAR